MTLKLAPQALHLSIEKVYCFHEGLANCVLKNQDDFILAGHRELLEDVETGLNAKASRSYLAHLTKPSASQTKSNPGHYRMSQDRYIEVINLQGARLR